MGKIAFVFSGQGAQYPGMGHSLYENSAAAKAVFDHAEALQPGILELCFNSDKAVLAQTINTQPCVFLTDIAAAYALQEQDITVSMMAGFSLGEVAAVCFSGMISFDEVFRLVLYRAKVMQQCAEKYPGAMFAVLKLETAHVEAIAEQFNEAYPVNYNCPGQVVVAVALKEADAFSAAIKTAGGRAVRLNVNGAFHSPFMKEASDKLYSFLDNMQVTQPNIPVYANLTATPYVAEAFRHTLSAQVSNPVQWEKTIRTMRKEGCTHMVEVGVGKTLVGLIQKIDPEIFTCRVEDIQTLQDAARQLQEVE